jgi:hypothetical protein
VTGDKEVNPIGCRTRSGQTGADVTAERAQPEVVGRGFNYESTIPYATPASLSDLGGPASGTVRVRPHTNTSPDPVYDLSNEAMVWHLYSAVVRDGTAQEQESILNRNRLTKSTRLAGEVSSDPPGSTD